MRTWERENKRQEEEGNKKWDDAIKEHFTKKEAWETGIRSQATEATISNVLSAAITELNAQLASSGSFAAGLTIDRISAVNEAIAKAKAGEPSFTDRFALVNKSIESFSTRLSTTKLIGANLGSDVLGVSGDYKEQMRVHKHQMKVLANVKIFEEYRKLTENLKEQLEEQNRQVDMQTQIAALSQGLVRSGATYILAGKSSRAVGAVNAYTFFDADRIVDEELAKAGFARLSDDALFEMLENKDTVEVESFFYTQKLAVQLVTERIMGRGTSEQRKTSQDEKVIGRFSAWAGRGPGDNEMYQQASQANAFSNLSGEQNDLLKYVMFAGFGEQGSSGIRPSGISMGFYPQLDLIGRMVGKADAQGMARAGGTLDPISSMVNNFNPAVIAANVAVKSQIAALRGTATKGDIIKGELMKAAKPILKVAVNVLAAAVAVGGSIFSFGAGSPAAIAAGAAIAVAGNALVDSIQVSDTGKITLKSNSQVWTNAAISGVAVAATAGIAGAVGATAGGALYNGIQTAVGTVQNVIQTGMKWDAQGRSAGFSLSGSDWGGIATGAAVSAATAGASAASGLSGQAASVFGGLTSKAINNTIEYSKDRYAFTERQRNAGGEALGELANLAGAGDALGSAATHGLGFKTVSDLAAEDAQRAGPAGPDNRSTWQKFSQGVTGYFTSMASGFTAAVGWQSATNYLQGGKYENNAQKQEREVTRDRALDLARKNADTNSQEQARGILNGLGYRKEEVDAVLAQAAVQRSDKSVTDVAYHLRAAAGLVDGRVKTGADGQREYAALEADLKIAAARNGNGQVSTEDMLAIADKHGIPQELVFSDRAAGESNRLRGNDIARFAEQKRQMELAKSASVQHGATGSWDGGSEPRVIRSVSTWALGAFDKVAGTNYRDKWLSAYNEDTGAQRMDASISPALLRARDATVQFLRGDQAEANRLAHELNPDIDNPNREKTMWDSAQGGVDWAYDETVKGIGSLTKSAYGLNRGFGQGVEAYASQTILGLGVTKVVPDLVLGLGGALSSPRTVGAALAKLAGQIDGGMIDLLEGRVSEDDVAGAINGAKKHLQDHYNKASLPGAAGVDARLQSMYYGGRVVGEVGSFFVGAGQVKAATTTARVAEGARVLQVADGVADAGRAGRAVEAARIGDEAGDFNRIASNMSKGERPGPGMFSLDKSVRLTERQRGLIEKLRNSPDGSLTTFSPGNKPLKVAFEDMRQMHKASGREIALIETQTGELRLLVGGPYNEVILPGNYKRIVAHTHPVRDYALSLADLKAVLDTYPLHGKQFTTLLPIDKPRGIRMSGIVDNIDNYVSQAQAMEQYLKRLRGK